MSKKQKKYSSEFKIGVIMDMREHQLGYNKTVRKYWDITGGQEHNINCPVSPKCLNA